MAVAAPRAPARITFVATDLSTGGGVNRVIRDLASLFVEELGANVAVVACRNDAKPSYAFPTSVQVEFSKPGTLLDYARALWRVRLSGPDFVIGSWTQDNILLIMAFLFSTTRVIVAEHQSWFFHARWLRLLRRIFYPFAWRVVVLNPAELRHYRRSLSNVRMIPNPVPAATIATNTSPREKLVIGIGHLESRKNFADAISAMAESRLEEKGWSLALIGQGPAKTDLDRLVKRLGLKRTTIHPPVKDLGAYYSRASCILVTSTIEVFSLVLAEAMRSGVVPIAYAADGPAFLLEDFPDHLVPLGSVGALTRQLIRFASSEGLDPLRNAMAFSIHSRFAPQVIAAEWELLFSERGRN